MLKKQNKKYTFAVLFRCVSTTTFEAVKRSVDVKCETDDHWPLISRQVSRAVFDW